MKKYLFMVAIIGLVGCSAKENYMQIGIRECFEKGGKITYIAQATKDTRTISSGTNRYIDAVKCETHHGERPANMPNVKVERPDSSTLIFRDMDGKPLID